MPIKVIKKILKKRTFRFLLGGGISALVNLLLIYIMIEKAGFNTPLLRSIANVVSIELSLIFSFFIYRSWVWTGGTWKISEVFGKQLPLYHLAAGIVTGKQIGRAHV